MDSNIITKSEAFNTQYKCLKPENIINTKTTCLQFNKSENENEPIKLDIICNSITIGNWKIQTEDVGEKQVLVIRDTKSQNDSRYAFWPDMHSDA